MNYQKQAQKFANKHNVKLSILGAEYRRYFPEDKDPRHVFKCRLIRGRRQYTFTFGQSINAGGVAPTMYDILACLTKYDPETFAAFCASYGYDEDSRTAERIYKAVCKEWRAVERLFSDILEDLQEIQ
jgi:hypothetical protein